MTKKGKVLLSIGVSSVIAIIALLFNRYIRSEGLQIMNLFVFPAIIGAVISVWMVYRNKEKTTVSNKWINTLVLFLINLVAILLLIGVIFVVGTKGAGLP